MSNDSPLFDRIRVKPDLDRRPRADLPGCQWPRCAAPATHRAPKGRLRASEYWQFCLEHVREYNNSYNFFAGMSDDAIAKYQKDDITGHRPTWKMGPRITIDSATLMNKALELIEARWLFGLEPDQIEVVLHPQSVIHSFVEFVDGSVLAQLSPPDMRLPIQYALTYPERVSGPTKRLNWRELGAWNFEQPDAETFPALQLGYEVAREGGTCGAVLNAANDR